MLDALPLAVDLTVAREVTLIIPLGLVLLTAAWAAWLLFGRGSGITSRSQGASRQQPQTEPPPGGGSSPAGGASPGGGSSPEGRTRPGGGSSPTGGPPSGG